MIRWNKVALIGLGLLGGSLGLALRKNGLANRIEGYVRRPEAIKEACDLGVVDSASCDLSHVVYGSDLVVLCTPLAQMAELSSRMCRDIQPGSLITDVGSVKGSLVRELEPIFEESGAQFVGSHPMAGGEKMGMSAARGDLFHDAVCVVTPTERTAKERIEDVRSLWTGVGSRVLIMDADQHDVFVSRTSHLPHVVAAALARVVLDRKHSRDQEQLCAGGFRDTTRIASGSPEMWRDIALSNRENLLVAVETLQKEIESLRLALERNDSTAMMDFLKGAKELRDAWPASKVPPGNREG